ncbi:phage tail protein [Nocardiopsis changdeensis]|uniref:Tape measure protein n=1 Tax=Nocardiopsis changdeensis TaxID=2831969 RepID=A0ABX8BLQ1_9ACTN|nr:MULTISPECIES: hypothetical protein [Nocardiopsis]QUX22974.1 hypothetical protein KGD84_00755 [Nocardiopsis changdeensis]QYX38917.1 hypothetical protein K1J57_10205 [Nocardiopsis sp. MT53]
MAMNVGELVATMDLEDRGYSRGLAGAAAEARVAANRIEDALDDIDASGAGARSGQGFGNGLLGAIRGERPRLMSAGADAGGGLSSGLTKAFGAISSNVWVMVGVVGVALAALPLLGATVGLGLALAFGGAIAGVGLAAAAQAQEVQDAFSDLKDNVVRDLKRMAEPLQGTLVDVAGDLQGLFDSLSPHLESAFAEMAPVLSEFSELLFGAFEGAGPVIDEATEAFNSLLGALGPDLEESLGGIWESLSDLFGTIKENPEPFAGIITGAIDLVGKIIKLVDWLSIAYVWINENIPGGLLGLLSPMVLLGTTLTDTAGKAGGFRDAIMEMAGSLSSAWEYIRGGAEELWEALQPILEDLWEALASSDILETIREWWSQLGEIFSLGGELIGEILSKAAEFLTWIWENFGTEIIGILEGLWEIISGIVSGGLEVIKGILNTVLGLITGDWDRAWNGVKQIGAGIWEALKGIIGGAIKIISNGLSATLKFIQGIWNSAWGSVKSTANNIWSGIVGAWNGLKNATSAAWSWMKSKITSLFSQALSTVRSKLSSWSSVGRDMIQGVINGVTGAAGRLYSKLRGIASSALESAKEALGISSPSRVMRDQVGRWIPEGIAAGLQLGQARLDSATYRMAAGIADSMTGALAVPGQRSAADGIPGPDRGGKDPAVWVEHFHATERMSPHDVGEALYGLVSARRGV